MSLRSRRGHCVKRHSDWRLTQTPCNSALWSYYPDVSEAVWSVSAAAAITSISTLAPLGSAETSTVERAGGSFLKYEPYISFTVWKSPRFVRKMVVLTTLSKLRPSVRKIAAMLSNTRRVCVAMSPETISPDFGSNALEMKENMGFRTPRRHAASCKNCRSVKTQRPRAAL